eukprot:c27179_g1_i1 orf=223-453(-)
MLHPNYAARGFAGANLQLQLLPSLMGQSFYSSPCMLHPNYAARGFAGANLQLQLLPSLMGQSFYSSPCVLHPISGD